MSNQSNYSIKWAAIGLLIYFLLTTIASAVLSSIWLTNNDIAGLTNQQIGVMMENDKQLALYTSMLGFVCAIVCAWFVTQKSISRHYGTSFLLAVMLTIYGLISIFLHPDHQLIHQIGKLIAPFIACCVGVYLARLKFKSPKSTRTKQARQL